jgi:hypothetical protein
MTPKTLALAVTLAAALSPLSAGAAPTDPFITYSGFLYRPDGSPETTAQSVKFSLWNVGSGGNAANVVWEETWTVTPGADGFFSQVLGATMALPTALEWDTQLFLELQVGVEPPMTPRMRVTPMPRALSVAWVGVTGRPQPCAGGTYLRGFDAAGQPLCDADSSGSGTVTSVSGVAPIAVANASTTPTVSLAACAANQIYKMNGAGTSWACAADADTSASYTGSAPIGVTGATISLTGCGANQIYKMNAAGTGWACAADVDTNSGGTIAGVTAGTGLVGGGTIGTVTLTANLATSGGDGGTATTIARGDHVHDGRYFTETELNAAGTINTAANPVDWTKLKNVPAGLADGVDASGVTSITAGTGLTGGTITGTGTIAVSFSPTAPGSGSATTVARSDHSHHPFVGVAGPLDGTDGVVFAQLHHRVSVVYATSTLTFKFTRLNTNYSAHMIDAHDGTPVVGQSNLVTSFTKAFGGVGSVVDADVLFANNGLMYHYRCQRWSANVVFCTEAISEG